MDLTARLDAEAAHRHGVITRPRARHLGLTDRQIRHRVDSGRWRRAAKDVFVVVGAPHTPRQTLLVACLRHGAAASHTSAAWLHGLVDTAPARPSVIRASVAGTRDRSTVLHRVGDLLPRDVVTIDSIRTTTATRTLLDLGCSTEAHELARLIDRARRERLTHPDALIARFVTLGRPGRRGTAVIRQVLTDIDADLALVESDLESMLVSLIVTAGLPRPSPQHEVVAAGHRYRLDLAYPERRIAIEADGFGVHGARDTFESDRRRQNHLVNAGWLILRFTWRQIVRRPEWVVAQIATALRSGPAG